MICDKHHKPLRWNFWFRGCGNLYSTGCNECLVGLLETNVAALETVRLLPRDLLEPDDPALRPLQAADAVYDDTSRSWKYTLQITNIDL